MNKNILVVLGGAILAAVLVAMLVQVTMGKKEVAPVQGLEVLVAAKDLRKGEELQKDDLQWKMWPEEALFKGAILRDGDKSADDVLKGRLERSFSEGEALVRSAIINGDGNTVVARLEPGERAVSIKVKAESMVAGFITPGAYVDVILTYKKRITISSDNSQQIKDMVKRNIENLATETILENVRVLAVDQKAVAEDKHSAKVGKTVTLAVSIRDAEKLALASEMGDVTLAMRGVGDDAANEKTPVVTDARVSTIDDEVFSEYQIIKSQSDESSGSVKIYNGSILRVSEGVTAIKENTGLGDVPPVDGPVSEGPMDGGRGMEE